MIKENPIYNLHTKNTYNIEEIIISNMIKYTIK